MVGNPQLNSQLVNDLLENLFFNPVFFQYVPGSKEKEKSQPELEQKTLERLCYTHIILITLLSWFEEPYIYMKT